MTTDEALLVADGHGGDAAQALAALAAEVRRLHALLDGADELAANPLRPGGRREWVKLGVWLYPGDRVLLMDGQPAVRSISAATQSAAAEPSGRCPEPPQT